MKYISSVLIVTSLLYSSQPLARAEENDAHKYEECLGLVDSDPKAAIKYAEDWTFGGTGGVPAGHCKAMALLVSGQAHQAAELLEKLVEDMTIFVDKNAQATALMKNAQIKVQLNAQAGLAWKDAGEFDKAYISYSAALSGIEPDKSAFDYNGLYHDLYLERGTLQILRGQYKEAIEDISLSIEKDDQNFEGYLQRAKAYRKKHAFLEARFDLRVAQKLQPDQADILLESGVLYRATGEKLLARQEWQKIIDLYPETEYSGLAKENIDLLKVE